MDKLEAMAAFVKVVSAGSYSEAARRLGFTRSAISKAVAELEAILGARLLDRTTRRVNPTEAGLAYYDRCQAILSQIEDSEAEIARLHDEPKGLLRINGPMSFGTLYLVDAVADFMAAFPDLRVELELTDRYIDPLEEGVDVTIRIGQLADSSLIARKIASAKIAIIASPAYLAAHGEPERPEDLIDHRCLEYGRRQAAPRWRLMKDGRPSSTPISSCLFSNNGEALRSAAVRGLGIGRLPTFIVGPDLRAGRLVAILEGYAPPDGGVHALYAPNRFVPAKVRAFIDFLAHRFEPPTEWERDPSPGGAP